MSCMYKELANLLHFFAKTAVWVYERKRQFFAEIPTRWHWTLGAIHKRGRNILGGGGGFQIPMLQTILEGRS